MKGCTVSVFKKFIPVFLCLIISITPFSVYALDTDMVESELKWIDCETAISYSSEYFEGFSKYIADKDEGCFYFFTRFTDYRIDPEQDDSIALGFTVENDNHNFYFKVDKNGVIGTPNDSVEVYYNFSESSCQRQGGGIFVAFKLKNKTDRTLNNFISCEYYCGDNLTYNMLESVSLDMYVPTTQKSTTAKTAKTTTNKNSQSGSTNEKSNKSTTAITTKFSGTGKYSSGQNSTKSQSSASKFSGSGTTDFTFPNNENGTVGDTADSTESDNVQSETSSLTLTAKLLIFCSIAVLLLALILFTISLTKKENNQPENTSDENDDVD